MGRDAFCNHCGARMHSDYEYPTEEKEKKYAHYMYTYTILEWNPLQRNIPVFRLSMLCILTMIMDKIARLEMMFDN